MQAVNQYYRALSRNAMSLPVPVITTFGTLAGGNKYAGGALANTGFIYAAPFDALNFLKIDPSTDTLSTIGSLANIGGSRCNGLIRGSNECLYTIPQRDSQVIKLDPSTDTITSFGSLGTVSGKWSGGCLASNGYIYGIPQTSTSVLKIDPNTDTLSTFGSVGVGTLKWSGGVYAANDKIYCAPGVSTSVLVIDTTSDTTSTIAVGSSGWYGGFLGYDDIVYFFSSNNSSVLWVDPSSHSFGTFGSVGATSNKWYCGTLSPNGIGYGAQFSNTSNILQIITPNTANLIPSSGGGYVGSVLAQNGDIYNIPLSATNIKKIGNIGTVNSGMYTLPSPLSGLASSVYNRHQNKY